MEQMNKYNTAVRRAMSDKYVECVNQKNEAWRKINELDSKLNSKEGKQLPYEEYVKLQKDLDYYERTHRRLKIEQDIWDQAREICMELADEML